MKSADARWPGYTQRMMLPNLIKWKFGSTFFVKLSNKVASTGYIKLKMPNSRAMKIKLLSPLFAVALMGAGSIFAQTQTTATTDPVGFVSNTVPANSDATVSPALQRTAAYVGTVGTLVDTDTITVGGTSPGWTTDQFKNTHYLLIGSGDREGLFAEIVGNTADSLDVVFFVGNFGTVVGDKVNVGDQVKIIPFWTLGTLLPDGAVADGTTVLLYNRGQAGINKSASVIYTMFAGFGWFDGPNNGNSQVIYPDESFVVRAPAGQSVTLTQTGAVPMDKIRTLLVNPAPGQDQDIRVTSGVPVAATLGSIFNPGAAGDGDTVLVFNDAASGQNKSATNVITYFNGFGWFDGPTDMSNLQLQPGQGLIYRKAGANSSQQVVVSFKPSYQP